MLNAMHNERVGKDDGVDVRVVLAFTNRNLDWPKSVNQLSSEVYNEAEFISVLEDEDPGELNEELLKTVAGFGTWDEVQLNGGLMCKGDVLGLGLGDDVEAWQSARTAALTAQVSHKSSFSSMFSSQPSSMELAHGTLRLSASLPYGAAMKMHVVGKKAPEEILWSTIEAINLSKPVAYPELGQE